MVKELDSLSWNSYDEDIGSNTTKVDRSNSTVSQIEGSLVLQHADQNETCPTFGNICISNGSDIHFGNKTFYQGPVTIKQFVVTDGDQLKKISEGEVSPSVVRKLNLDHLKEGVQNVGFQQDGANEKGEDKIGDTSESVGNIRARYFKVLDLQKLLIQHKISVVAFCLFLCILLISAFILAHFPKRTEAVLVKHSTDTKTVVDDENSHNTPIKGPIDPRKIKPLVLKMVSRLEWLAQPPSNATDPLETPVPYVIISHTATETCRSQAQCIFQVRVIQTYHMESRGWYDIGYNFLVGGDSEVYVGRGWNTQGAHTIGYNKYSIGISFIGTFIDSLPSENQLLACKRLIKKGIELGYVRKDYKLVGARQLQTTQSPGTKLFEEIKKWPHWTDAP